MSTKDTPKRGRGRPKKGSAGERIKCTLDIHPRHQRAIAALAAIEGAGVSSADVLDRAVLRFFVDHHSSILNLIDAQIAAEKKS